MTSLESALKALADVFGNEELGGDVGTHMTCAEADTFARVLKASGDRDGAAYFLLGHATDDEDEDDHGGWIEEDDDEGRAREMARARAYVDQL